jgi:uncharacterized protein YcbX
MTLGKVMSIRRYPVKSMAGEELDRCEIRSGGLIGDRAWAIVDTKTGMTASAKNPRAWPGLLDLRAHREEDGVVVIRLPDGSVVRGESDASERLSAHFGRRVTLATSGAGEVEMEISGGQITTFRPLANTFFDAAPLHLLTTATLARLSELRTGGNFDVRRFRPNLLIDTPGASGFIENEWVGRTLGVGSVRLRVTMPCERCVMTTLAQDGLPADREVLADAVRHNSACVGVYAVVVADGMVVRGDDVRFVE